MRDKAAPPPRGGGAAFMPSKRRRHQAKPKGEAASNNLSLDKDEGVTDNENAMPPASYVIVA